MLKIMSICGGKLYITDDEKEAKRLAGVGEAVLFICNNVYETPFIDGIKYVTDSLEDCDEKYLETVYCRQKHQPLSILETINTRVREITVADLPELYELYDDDVIRKFVEPLYDYGEEKKFTENYIENVYGLYGYGYWLVFDKESGRLAGRAGVSVRNIDGEECNEIGYVFGRDFRGRGYALEVCRAIVEYAFSELDIRKLHIITEPNNLASIRLGEKLGFTIKNKTEEYIIMQKNRED